MRNTTDVWKSGNIKKTVDEILTILDGYPINCAKHVLDEVEKKIMSYAIIQSSEYLQQASSAVPDKTVCKQSQLR